MAGEGRGLLEAEPVRHVNLALHSRDQRPIPDLTADTLVRHYLGYLAVSAAAAAEAFRLLTGVGLPAVVHCAAGKDRTGVMAGLVLRAVGVPADVVAEDYARSAESVPAIIARLRRLPAYADRIDLLPPEVHECRAETMAEFLRAVDEQYGSVSAFLREAPAGAA